MKKTILLITLILLFNQLLFSQFINSRLNVYFSSGYSKTQGNTTVDEEGFITPSLFNNFKSGKNFALAANYKLFAFIGTGVLIRNTSFSGWEMSSGENLYTNSKAGITSIGAILKLGTPATNEGLFNKFTASIQCIPTYNMVNVKLDKSIFSGSVSDTEDYLNSRTSSIGAEAIIQLEYSIHRNAGIFVHAGLSYVQLKSIFYNDPGVIYFNTGLGAFLRLSKDKHFYYR
jgi:hypothetical protein